MTSEWDEYAQDWDSNPDVQKYANNAFLGLTSLCDLKGKNILDFGCGTGVLSQLMSNQAKQVVAIDPSAKMIERLTAKSLNNVIPLCDYLNVDLVNVHPAFNQKFDVIVASSVCAFLPNYVDTLALLKSLLKANGLFVQWDWFAEKEGSGKGLTQGNVERALNSAQFVEVNFTLPFTMVSEKGSAPVLMAYGRS